MFLRCVQFIPQESNLGPLLFSLNFNDLSKFSEVLIFVNFAQNTKVLLYQPSSDASYLSFNEELYKVIELLGLKCFPFNVDKTC